MHLAFIVETVSEMRGFCSFNLGNQASVDGCEGGEGVKRNDQGDGIEQHLDCVNFPPW